jgi:hypothetical protein
LLTLGPANTWRAVCVAAQHYESRQGESKLRATGRPHKRNARPADIPVLNGELAHGESELPTSNFATCKPLGAQAEVEVSDGELSNADGAGPAEDDATIIHELDAAEPAVDVQGAELLNQPPLHWGGVLGYTRTMPEDSRVRNHNRGCVNEGMTHCYALSVIHALSASWRVHSWCMEHRSRIKCALPALLAGC